MERIQLELTLKSGAKATFFLSDFVLVNGSEGTRIVDGIHNNGGWTVKESYTDILKMIEKQKKK